MPPAGVCDLRDVVDAINELCDSMRTSRDGPGDDEPALEVRFDRVTFASRPPTVELETFGTRSVTFDPEPAGFDSASALPSLPTLNPEPAASDLESAPIAPPTFNPEPAACDPEPPARTVFDPEPAVFDPEPAPIEPTPCESLDEMYYTASSEASLLSDTDLPDRVQGEDSDRDRDDRDSVMAGHVAAMRERFESMTRTNTPCPDLMRSTSPSFEVFRNISSSPDIEKT